MTIDDSSPLEAQSQAGHVEIDVSLVAHMLTLSPEVRNDAHESARELVYICVSFDESQIARDYAKH